MQDEAMKREAMSLMLDAWESAAGRGVPNTELAEICLYMGLTELVDQVGEETTASFVEGLISRVRAGEFSLGRDDGAA